MARCKASHFFYWLQPGARVAAPRKPPALRMESDLQSKSGFRPFVRLAAAREELGQQCSRLAQGV